MTVVMVDKLFIYLIQTQITERSMQLKTIKWDAHNNTQIAVVMGITLAVHKDTDGTWTASLSGVPNQRPELQKLFDNEETAKEYAVDNLLHHEIKKHFVFEPVEPKKPDGVYDNVWDDFKNGDKPDRYVLNVTIDHMSFGKHTPTVTYLYGLGYRRVSMRQRDLDFSHDVVFAYQGVNYD